MHRPISLIPAAVANAKTQKNHRKKLEQKIKLRMAVEREINLTNEKSLQKMMKFNKTEMNATSKPAQLAVLHRTELSAATSDGGYAKEVETRVSFINSCSDSI